MNKKIVLGLCLMIFLLTGLFSFTSTSGIEQVQSDEIGARCIYAGKSKKQYRAVSLEGCKLACEISKKECESANDSPCSFQGCFTK